MKLDPYITHTFEGLEGVNEAIKALHGGDCLRAVVHVAKNDTSPDRVSFHKILLYITALNSVKTTIRQGCSRSEYVVKSFLTVQNLFRIIEN